VSEVSCPRCNSKRASVYEKEIQAGWTLGLPKVAEYRRGAKETFKECLCIDCKKRFRHFPAIGKIGDVSEAEQEWKLLGKAVKIDTRSGEPIVTEIDGIMVTVKVNVGKTEIIVDDQMSVTFSSDKKLDTPALVLDQIDVPIGVLWAGSRDEQGIFHGIVTPIKLWKPAS